MARRMIVLAGLALLALLALGGTAQAGGWTVVTVDTLPQEARVGEVLRLGFMLRQHGETPVHEYGGEPLRPLFLAHNEATSEEVSAEGVADTEVGHFTVEVVFPSAGTWEWTIDPRPFQGKTEPVTLEVLLAQARVETEVAGVAAPAPLGSRALLRGAGVVLLGVGLALALLRRR